MDTKLTLKINKRIIERAKKYAKQRETSLSKMVENYLQTLTNKEEKNEAISPLVESLSGVIKFQDSDYKKDYTDFLSEKYK
jgi:deoxyxylulose-5-phosphate synthase